MMALLYMLMAANLTMKTMPIIIDRTLVVVAPCLSLSSALYRLSLFVVADVCNVSERLL